MAIHPLLSDICIIGAGPAGMATSIFLSKRGISHAIVDAAKFPRDKVCGDGLDIKTVRMLNHIDPTLIQHEILHHDKFQPSWGFRLVHPNGKMRAFQHLPNDKSGTIEPPLFISKRIDFDAFLLNKLQPETAQFFQETRITKIEKVDERWHLYTKDSDETPFIICKLIVGADGDHSTVLKYVGERKVNRKHYAGAVRQYWKNVSHIHDDKLIDIYFPKRYPMSYFWIFPLPNNEANVGYGITSSVAADMKINVREVFEDLIQNDPALNYRFKEATPLEKVQGWGIPFASLNRKAFGDGWLLVGDAASMVVPTTGEGIGTGMMTGYIAAHFIEKAVKTNNYSAQTFKHYNREIAKRTEDEVKIFNRLMSISPKALSFVMNNVVNNTIFQKYFEYVVKKWVHTAYHKPLIVHTN